MIGERPKVASPYGELEDEGVFSGFAWWTRHMIRWRKNLHARPIPPPPTLNSKAAEAILAPYRAWTRKNRLLDLTANTLPLCGIERGAWFYSNDLFISKGKCDSTSCTPKGKIQSVGFLGTILILSGSSDAFV